MITQACFTKKQHDKNNNVPKTTMYQKQHPHCIPPPCAHSPPHHPNQVWHVSTGTLAYELHHRPRSADLPTLEFSCDDIYAYHMVTNTIHRYHTPSWTHNSNNSSDTQGKSSDT